MLSNYDKSHIFFYRISYFYDYEDMIYIKVGFIVLYYYYFLNLL